MLHPRVTTGVFIRVGLFVLMVPLAIALGGCSLFGIATKGNLNELAEEQNLQNQELQAQVVQSEQKMDTRVNEVEDQTRRIDQELTAYETQLQSTQVLLQSIKLDLDAFENELERASTDSKHALRIHHEGVVSERDRLQQRLNEINTLIYNLEELRRAQPEGTVTPVPGGLIVPEKQLESQGTVDATQTSNETSVWDKRRAGGN